MDLILKKGVMYMINHKGIHIDFTQRANVDRYLIPNILKEVNSW